MWICWNCGFKYRKPEKEIDKNYDIGEENY